MLLAREGLSSGCDVRQTRSPEFSPNSWWRRTSPKSVLQCLGFQATEVARGVGHPVHSSAVSPQPQVMAASQLGQQ